MTNGQYTYTELNIEIMVNERDPEQVIVKITSDRESDVQILVNESAMELIEEIYSRIERG